VVASPIARGYSGGAITILRRDAGLHESPNAGVCEAAYAGALGVQLGGPGVYNGTPVHKPELGAGLDEPVREDISRAARLMYVSSALFLAAGMFARLLIRVFRIRRAPGSGRRG